MNASASRPERIFSEGMLCGMLLIIGANGLHWFITPAAHPDAGLMNIIGAMLQVVVSFVAAFSLSRRARRRFGAEPTRA